MNSRSLLLSIAFVSFAISLSAQSKPSAYKAPVKLKIEGDGGWDYITSDEQTGLVYISHGTVVQVLDTKSGTLKATIPDTKGVHGIAIAHDLNKGFISCGKDTAIMIFDLKTAAVLAKIKVTGINPDAVLYDPFSHYVFAFNGRSSNATVINGNTQTVVATIPLDGKPEFSVSDEKGNVYVNIENKSTLCRINTKDLKVDKTWPIAPGEEASGLAIDNKYHRLFMVCDNKMMVVMDAGNGTVLSNLPIGEGADGVAFDPGKERAYSSNGDGTMTVVQGEKGTGYKVLETVATQKGARTITVDTKTHHLYLPTAEFEPPVAGEEKKRPALKKGTFTILDIAPAN